VTQPGAGLVCPACGAARSDATARSCEVCRFDFETRAPGPPPAAPAGRRPAGLVVPVDLVEPAGHAGWEVTIVVDPSLDADPDPGYPPPADAGERLFPIDRPEMLVGRRDDSQQIRPEIPVLDPGVSRRHASLFQLPGGRLAILDLASANGTVVNGASVAPGERRELDHGDTVTMGRWTRITVRRRNR
jgi:hypothetical protein